MKNDNFDELQVRNRQKIAYQTMFITFIIILFNGIIKEFYIAEWASPALEANILIVIPALYFISACIWKNAYFTETKKSSNIIMLLFLIIGVIGIASVLFKKDNRIENNILSADNSGLVTGLFFIAISIEYWIKSFIDSQKYKYDDK